MRKKVLLLTAILSLFFVGVVSAAGLWGNYKGKAVIRLTVDNVPVKITDAPAVSMDGRTMVPLYLLQQAGISYNWDQKNQTVNINTKSNQSNSGFSIPNISKDAKAANVEFVEYVSDGKGFNQVTFYYDLGFNSLNGDTMDKIYKLGLKTDSVNIKIVDKDNNSLIASVSKIQDFYAGRISEDQLAETYKVTGPFFSNNTNSTPAVITQPSPELYSYDGKVYLGKLTSNKIDTDSVYNEYGTYGSKYETKSIWNEYGDYGSKYSDTSAFNKYATKPPAIVLDGKIIGYLTLNSYTTGAISPYDLSNWLSKNGY